MQHDVSSTTETHAPTRPATRCRPPSPSRRVSRSFGEVPALADLDLTAAHGRDHRAARPQRGRQDHRHPGDHRRPHPRRGHGARLRARPGRRRGAGAPTLRRRVGEARALRPALGSGQPRVRGRAVRAGPPRRRPHRGRRRALRHRRGARPEGRRLLDRHEDPPGPGPVGAARPRAAAVRRAHLRARPRVVPRRARAHPRDDRGGPHGGDVHPPARRGRGPGRPHRRARRRHRPAGRDPGGAHPPVLASQPGPARRRGPGGPRPRRATATASWP